MDEILQETVAKIESAFSQTEKHYVLIGESFFEDIPNMVVRALYKTYNLDRMINSAQIMITRKKKKENG